MDPRTSLDQIWLLRWNQKIEACIEALQAWKHSTNPEERLEVILIDASIDRTFKRTESAKNKLAEAESLAVKQGIFRPFSLNFEKGLTAFNEGDFSRALEFFLDALHSSHSIAQKGISLTNTILCFENLSMPYQSHLSHLETLLTPTNSDLHFLEEEICALQARELFREGEIRSALNLLQSRHSAQCRHLKIYFESLPYHRSHRPFKESLLELTQWSSENPFFYMRSYRYRTLRQIQHPDDIPFPKPSLMIDRLYLWWWQAMASHSSTLAQKTWKTLSEIQFRDLLPKITQEDRSMLRNLLLWFQWFDSKPDPRVQKLIAEIESELVSEYPVFEFEKLFVHYLLALKENSEDPQGGALAQDYLKILTHHPLWNSKELTLRALLSVNQEPPPHPLAAKIQSILLKKNRSSPNHPILEIDLSTYEIHELKTGSKKHSRSVANGLHLLSCNQTVRISEFAAGAFGLSRFDETIHMGKVFNCLSRMRTIAKGKIQFHTRSGFIVTEGDWNAISWKQPETGVTQMVRSSDYQRFLYGLGAKAILPRAARVPLPLMTQKDPRTLTRPELEEFLQKSKATANRQILKWTQKGLLKPIGRARARRYEITPELSKSLNELRTHQNKGLKP